MQKTLHCGRFRLDLSRPLVMGILNITPDSFSDGGAFASRDAALRQAERMLAEGVALLDIGGESSRPGAEAVPLQQELERVLPVVEALRDCGVPLSVDTCKPGVMRAAIAAGADMINDIQALQQPGALEAVAASDCAVCLMHMRETPQTMQLQPDYAEVLDEVRGFLDERLQVVMAGGIARERVVVDPGFGFGKTLEHNLRMLNRLDVFAAGGVTVLAGISRKSMLGAVTGRPVGQRLAASIAAAVIAVERGARIVRAHDVAETVDALKIWAAVRDESVQ